MKIKYTIGAVLVLAILALTGCQTKDGNTINVSGQSELLAKPDEAEVWAGISIVKDTADEAQNEANKVINDIVDGLKAKGINEKDIQTESLNLYEERTWTENEGSKLEGWRATQTLKVKTTDLSKVGDIVDAAVDNGANQIQNINFQLSDAKEAEYREENSNYTSWIILPRNYNFNEMVDFKNEYHGRDC